MQQNSDPCFGASIRLYPNEVDYLAENTPVLTGSCNQEDEVTSWSYFESFDLYNGEFYLDIIFQDSIGNWAIDGAETQFSGSADGGENITVGGPQLGLNYHELLLGTEGKSTWELEYITDGSGNVTSNVPLCLTDINLLEIRKSQEIVVVQGSLPCGGAPASLTLDFDHRGSQLAVDGMPGTGGTTIISIDNANQELVYTYSGLWLHYTKR